MECLALINKTETTHLFPGTVCCAEYFVWPVQYSAVQQASIMDEGEMEVQTESAR